MTQPWSQWEPRLNDYAGYSLTSGNFFTFKKITLLKFLIRRSFSARFRQLYSTQTVCYRCSKGRTESRGNSVSSPVSRIAKLKTSLQDERYDIEKLKSIFRNKIFLGRQTGEYFGASVISADVNGDGVDEVIIGAPLFTHRKLKIATSGPQRGKV